MTKRCDYNIPISRTFEPESFGFDEWRLRREELRELDNYSGEPIKTPYNSLFKQNKALQSYKEVKS